MSLAMISTPPEQAALIQKVREAIPTLAGDDKTRTNWDVWALLDAVDRSGAFRIEGCSCFGAFCEKLESEFKNFGALRARTYLRIYRGFHIDDLVRTTASLLPRFHGTIARLSIANYADMIRFYRRLLQATAQ